VGAADTLDLRAAARATDPAREEDDTPLVPRERIANIAYHEKRASVVLRAPDGTQRTHADRLAATLAGVPWAQLSPLAQARFQSLAIFTVCISKTPDWLDAAAQEDDELLFALAGAAEAHALAYFLRDDGSGAAAERPPRVVVALADT
jgi:hypothetical protein